MSVGALTLPLQLHPAVPVIAFLVALAPVLATAVGRPGPLDRIGAVAASGSRALLAAAAVAAVWDRHVFVSSAGVAPDDVLAAIVVAAAVLLPRGARGTALLIGLALGAYLVAGMVLIAAMPYHSDAVVATHGAARLLLDGRHPYADFDMTLQLRDFGLPETFATPLEDGTRLHSFDYPALAFLLPAPFVAAGLADVRALYLIEVAAIFVLAMLAIPARWRTLVLAAGIGDLAVLDQHVLAGVDPTWALLLIVAWLTRNSRWSAVALGLAIVARQPAWLAAPFLLVWVWRALGREALVRAAIAATVALIVQLPFLVTAPGATAHGLTDAAFLPLEPRGVGPSGLLAAGIGPLLPRGVYLAAAVLGYAAALWAAAAGRVRGPLALPLLPLWLSWRALQSYFAFLGLFVVVDRAEGRSRAGARDG